MSEHDDLPTETKPKSPKVKSPVSAPKSKFPIGYSILAAIVSIITALITLKWYFAFHIIDYHLYATSFYSWRLKAADELMFNETWKYIKGNKYDPNDKDLAPFIDLAQNTNCLLFDLHPEHYPRTPKYYYTHAFLNTIPGGLKFLEFRKAMVEKTGHVLTDDQKSGKTVVNQKNIVYWTKKADSEVPREWTNEDYVSIYHHGNSHREVYNYMKLLTKFLDDLYYGKDSFENVKVNKNTPDIIAKRIEMLVVEAIKDQKESKDKFIFTIDMAKEVPHLFGKVSSGTMHNFFYSRIFYLVYLNTLDVEIIDISASKIEAKLDAKYPDDKDKVKKEEERKKELETLKNNKSARAQTVAACLAQIWIKIYEKDIDEAKKWGWFKRNFWKIFGIQKAELIMQDTNIKQILDSLKKRFDLDDVE